MGHVFIPLFLSPSFSIFIIPFTPLLLFVYSKNSACIHACVFAYALSLRRGQGEGKRKREKGRMNYAVEINRMLDKCVAHAVPDPRVIKLALAKCSVR